MIRRKRNCDSSFAMQSRKQSSGKIDPRAGKADFPSHRPKSGEMSLRTPSYDIAVNTLLCVYRNDFLIELAYNRSFFG